MNRLRILLIAVVLASCTTTAINAAPISSLNQSNESVSPYYTSPIFPGGNYALFQYISNNIIYPEEAQKNGIQGKVIVLLLIKEDGSIGDVKIHRSIDPLLDAEAIRVVKTLPNFQPAKVKEKTIETWYLLPIIFKLSTDTEIIQKQ